LVEADTQGRPRTVFFTVDLEKLLSVGETDVPGVKTGIVQKKAIVGLHGPFLVIEQKGSRMEAENIGIGGLDGSLYPVPRFVVPVAGDQPDGGPVSGEFAFNSGIQYLNGRIVNSLDTQVIGHAGILCVYRQEYAIHFA